jgi:4-alpha-glucanotransferase
MRLDHVMGLWRLFLVPRGVGPANGAYVTYRSDELLDIVALESHRANAFVVGEDLGTVEEHVRTELAARAMLSYRVLWFEERPPDDYPKMSLATVTNHDLPTAAGLWTGEDLRRQQVGGLVPDVDAAAAIARRLRKWTGLGEDCDAREATLAIYRLLARAPSALLTATLDDALGVTERPNQPGTTEGWPNWSLALPEPLETIERSQLAREIAETLATRAR